jgi:hypothetical protein
MKILKFTALCMLLAFLPGAALADEGMYPISEIGKLDLSKSGLQVTARDIFNPSGVSLIDAVVNTGGCTGSFVSPDGLILTNHHCVFGMVQAVSTVEKDYVTHGYLARTRAEEISVKGGTVRITDSYRDVSKEVLAAVSDTMQPGARSRAISAAMRRIVADTEANHPGKRAEVAEMFAGKTYVLFVYTNLRDVRIVYVPPRDIGEFGGENDNWVWPRHTGDFSFLRAYVAPDGTPAAYSTANVPYRPKTYLKVQPKGVDEEDPVFILGYPGRTYRHRTSSFLRYEEEVRMPYATEWMDRQIATMEDLGKPDRSIALKLDARIKGLANTTKNFHGKLQGMRRLGLVAAREADEKKLQEFIDADPALGAKYGSVLRETAAVYAEMTASAPRDLTLDYLRSSSTLLGAAIQVLDAARERAKPDAEREAVYAERTFSRTVESTLSSLQNYHFEADSIFLSEMLRRASLLPPEQRIGALELWGVGGEGGMNPSVGRALRASRLPDTAYAAAALRRGLDSAALEQDALLRLARALQPEYRKLRETRQIRDGELSRLAALYVDVRQLFLQKSFIPDANSTLRFTYGRIRGYTPSDATRYTPITTLRGVAEKTTGTVPFRSPEKLLQLERAKDYGRYAHPRLKSVPVALLYNLDTTGGNSGSPLLNARGEIVGVNFDRAFEATINDYAWSEEYSRSIAVDIRYVLWVTEKIGGATHILHELGVAP